MTEKSCAAHAPVTVTTSPQTNPETTKVTKVHERFQYKGFPWCTLVSFVVDAFELSCLLQCMRHPQDRGLVKMLTQNLQPNRQLLARLAARY